MPWPAAFTRGVIEGYFGRQWSWQCRKDYAGFLRAHGFDTYVYAPKNDAWLRKAWHVPYPPHELAPLLALREHYSDTGVAFGIGFSPFELYRDFSDANRALLDAKLKQLSLLRPDLFCILFDDMLGELDALASLQLDIIDFVMERIDASAFAVCPTYYSYDPLLVKHFGKAPERYLDELGQQLDPAVQVFWTGPQVISADYPREHLEEVGQRLRRKPLLWDNYPVNDAKRLTPFLHLAPPTGRDPAVLGALCSGQLCNPMNQGYLSQLPLHALSHHWLHGQPDSLQGAAKALCAPGLAALIARDGIRFQQEGLESLTSTEREMLVAEYAAVRNDPMAKEVLDWMKGGYEFDPACLT